jgi:hypothetical protein
MPGHIDAALSSMSRKTTSFDVNHGELSHCLLRIIC